MGCLNKTFAVFIMLSLFTSVAALAQVATAQAIPMPSVPEFTVNFNRTFYTITAPDPVNGENITQHFQNNTIQVTIENSNYPISSDESQYPLYYNIRIKLHSEDNWNELYPPELYYNNASDFNSTALNLARTPQATTSEYTTISFYDYYPGYPPNTEIGFTPPIHFPPGSQLDLEVQAIIGVHSQVYIANHPTAPHYGGHYEPAIVVGAASNWSSTQTVTIDNSTITSPTPSPEATPTLDLPRNAPHLDPVYYVVPISVVVAVVVLSILVYRRHRRIAKP